MIDRFMPGALAELIQAMNYLDSKVVGLGDALLDEVDKAIRTIKEQPDRWPVLVRDVRRFRLSRFRYYVIYKVDQKRLLIIAVMHTSRRPGYWKDRI